MILFDGSRENVQILVVINKISKLQKQLSHIVFSDHPMYPIDKAFKKKKYLSDYQGLLIKIAQTRIRAEL